MEIEGVEVERTDYDAEKRMKKSLLKQYDGPVKVNFRVKRGTEECEDGK